MAVSGTGQGETPQSLATRAIAGFPPAAENGTKAALTTGMTTDRKIFDFLPRRGIMAEIEYPGVAKLVSRLIWVQETGRSSRPTRTKPIGEKDYLQKKQEFSSLSRPFSSNAKGP